MSIPQITEFTIRRHANTKSFQRGEAYYEAGAVHTVTQRGHLLQAEVAGTEARPYHVNLSFDSSGLTSANCTCAYNFDGWCKHIIATMLVCARDSESIEQRPTLEQLLNRLDNIQTQRLLQELVNEYPPLIEAIDRHVGWMTNPIIEQTTIRPVRHRTIDPAPIRRQVRQIIRDAVRYFEEGGEEDPIAEELVSVVQSAVAFSERGEGENAIAILEAITFTCVENWDDIADYGAENDEIVGELNEAWCEAILTAELTPEEKVDIQINLEAWQDEWNADFGLVMEALRQGWDYPPLVQVLQGNITERGAWEEDVPDYADDLALIRLKILEHQERYQEYLYLAEAEGQTQQYLTMLGRLGRVEEAVDAAQTQMNSMGEAFALAKALSEQGALQQSLDIAQSGLNLPGNCQYELGIWTSDLAVELGNSEAALLAIKAAFQVKPSFVDYEKMAELAGENWETVKTDLLRIIRTYSGWGTESAKVDIFLHEGLIDDAIAIASELSSYYSELIHRVMNAAIPHNPTWVIANARRRAEKIMDGGKAEYYYYAVEWLKKVRAAYLESGKKADWLRYRENLMQTHARKRKLMGMLQQRDME
ncbi:SWIM zinc finger domain-containing protein [Nostoc sp. UCD121]|uniref:SWIM zinc finger family protein n=1 Tax=unclassified Nostoc TaxID=2593658 RepID=UPI00162A734D|nr:MULTISPECIES: SWIM zinc finger family protein [unclassified Nostoc]MBC1222747.1 SWIM zinc finger domain-containing protein [Nostoc sp. UCD120]MBC1275782.1 SWIM zinc finger domain-containing protein [Nostoc sp. UCD121]MBC1295228.1 SWIM zinc finger domain-containing protein [Nostoc sp. UCD122]